MGDKELQGYGFKTGDGLLDVASFKTLKKSVIIEEIDFKGAMCAFHPFKAVITDYPNEDILFVWDPDERKEADCNFYFCSTPEVYEEERTKLGITEDGQAMDAEEMKKKKEEEEMEEKRIKWRRKRKKSNNELQQPLLS